MASNVTFRATSGVLTTEREHVATMAAPVRADVRERLETVGNAVIDFFFVILYRRWVKNS
jgi:hypothetical protein